VFRQRGWSGELIVCDNNSTDRTAELAYAADATVVFEPVNQIARARNAGARAGSGEWLLFVDADSSPSKELFQDVLAAIESGRYVGGGCTVAIPGLSPAARTWLGIWNALSRAAQWAAGAFLFCEAAAFRAAGGFSEELFASEEIDLSRRLKRRGRFIILSPARHERAKVAALQHARALRLHLEDADGGSPHATQSRSLLDLVRRQALRKSGSDPDFNPPQARQRPL
jgi:glycosyltransferase involved in cell wall biosynthesis